MPFRANVIKVMIASPGDVALERQEIRDVIAEWNYIHAEDRNQVLLPVGWETHSTPMMGDRPQAIINKQVLADCDLLVAVFWTRLGSHTGVAASGTVEEIEEHLSAEKPAMIYFSDIPVRMDSVDEDQYRALKEFKQSCYRRGLVEGYESFAQFRDKFSRQLAQSIIRHFSDLPINQDSGHDDSKPTSPEQQLVRDVLGDDAKEMLLAAVETGHLLCSSTMSGTTFQAGRKTLSKDRSPRESARWKSALDELVIHDLVQDASYKGEVFNVTHRGYEVADEISESKSVPDSPPP